MITGFNTDIEHCGTVYHVQTEDKGLETPFILSLVYVGGAILASKRAPYDDLLGAGFDQSVLSDRLQRQHKLICAAVNAGRIEDLKRMSQREVTPQAGDAPPIDLREPAKVLAGDQDRSRTDVRVATEAEGAQAARQKLFEKARRRTKAKPSTEVVAATSDTVEANVVAVEDNIGESNYTTNIVNAYPAADATVEVSDAAIKIDASDFAALDHHHVAEVEREESRARATSSDVTLVAAAADVANALHDRFEASATEALPAEIDDALHVELLGEKDYHAGEMVTLRVAVLRGAFGFREVVRGSNVTVKVLGTEFRPLILTSKTDDDGVAVVHVWLPRFKNGRAAILIRAHSDDCSAELRRIIHHI